MPESVPSTILLAILVAMPTLAVPVASQASDPGEVPPGSPQWSVSKDVNPDTGFAYTATRTQGDTPARMTGIFNLEDTKLELRYRAPPPDQADPDETIRSVNLTLRLSAVYEFRDVNGNDRFDLGDEVVRADPISPSQRARVEPIDGPGLIEGARAIYPLENIGRLVFETRTSPRPEPLGDRNVYAPGPALNITLEESQPIEDDTHLAVLVRLGDTGLEHVAQHTIHAEGNGARALFEWTGNATSDDRVVPVSETVLEQRVRSQTDGQEEILVAWSTATDGTIQHPVDVRIEHTESTVDRALAIVKGDPLLFTIGLILTVGLIGASAWAKLQQSSRRVPSES